MTSISVRCNGEAIPVEIKYYFRSGDGRHLVRIKAKHGKPFSSYSHGGWTDDNSTNVPTSSIHLEPDECTCTPDGDACPACVAANQARYGDDFPFVRSAK
jgi:hypothetical protein